jgi:predicted ribosomally synthesized peptide with nif11-like leader
MSKKHTLEFIEKMKSDKAFRARVLEIENVDTRMAFINGEGFRCTQNEIRQVQAELTNDELLVVTGAGLWNCHMKTLPCCKRRRVGDATTQTGHRGFGV